jgi:hypothetical protein
MTYAIVAYAVTVVIWVVWVLVTASRERSLRND